MSIPTYEALVEFLQGKLGAELIDLVAQPEILSTERWRVNRREFMILRDAAGGFQLWHQLAPFDNQQTLEVVLELLVFPEEAS
jgi:hypothetical protein